MLGEIMNQEDLVFRLRKRAEIRRQISSRKSVQQGQPDRISDILEEAANEIESLRKKLSHFYNSIDDGK
jgi:hypothetical protein